MKEHILMETISEAIKSNWSNQTLLDMFVLGNGNQSKDSKIVSFMNILPNHYCIENMLPDFCEGIHMTKLDINYDFEQSTDLNSNVARWFARQKDEYESTEKSDGS